MLTNAQASQHYSSESSNGPHLAIDTDSTTSRYHGEYFGGSNSGTYNQYWQADFDITQPPESNVYTMDLYYGNHYGGTAYDITITKGSQTILSTRYQLDANSTYKQVNNISLGISV